MPQRKFQRGIRKSAAVVLRHNDIAGLVPQLQQRFEHAVILVIVGDQHIIDLLGQVSERIALDSVSVIVANERITEDRDISRFNENTGVAEVSNT